MTTSSLEYGFDDSLKYGYGRRRSGSSDNAYSSLNSNQRRRRHAAQDPLSQPPSSVSKQVNGLLPQRRRRRQRRGMSKRYTVRHYILFGLAFSIASLLTYCVVSTFRWISATEQPHASHRLHGKLTQEEIEQRHQEDMLMSKAGLADGIGRKHPHEKQEHDDENAWNFKSWLFGGGGHGEGKRYSDKMLQDMLVELEKDVVGNRKSESLLDPAVLPSIGTEQVPYPKSFARAAVHGKFFRVARAPPSSILGIASKLKGLTSTTGPMAWESEIVSPEAGPKVDYTKHSYKFPEEIKPVEDITLGDYPKLRSMKEIMDAWPQDELDNPPSPIVEVLAHFDFNEKHDMALAQQYFDAKLPFKLTNVPELIAAREKWTDEYVSRQFDADRRSKGDPPLSSGNAQESRSNFFAFFSPRSWDVTRFGLPPTRNNDWTYEKWAKHARYADAVGLDSDQPHFYWQSGVPLEERTVSDTSRWTFVSRDLPSWSDPEPNFIGPHPEFQKGIQCRFGERGVTAATHYDSGRNMVGMITGAKRYILSPPRECSKLGIHTKRHHPVFRHSLLNFARLTDRSSTSELENAWLDRAGSAEAVETVLKSGEALFIPSHWFHYITSLQKSAQCNVRSGVDVDGDEYFGGQANVVGEQCMA